MFKINRVKAISYTEKNSFGFDYKFDSKLNLVSSSTNTKGKSSVLVAIYYCLGFEEIIGGKGKKTLTPVYKTEIKDESGETHKVLQSEVWLEITNGYEVITIMRSAETEGRNENLVTVFYSSLDEMGDKNISFEDMYVHEKNSAVSAKGFHAFLEKFIGFELPQIPSSDGKEYKLYMQLIFSGLFIEQKRGWADLFSAMPIYSIKESKKRVVEYILGLDTYNNEKKRIKLKYDETEITREWKHLLEEAQKLSRREDCLIAGIPVSPRILADDFKKQVLITTISDKSKTLLEYIDSLESKKAVLLSRKPKVVDNFDELQSQLESTEQSIFDLEKKCADDRKKLVLEKNIISKLKSNLSAIQSDLRNNKDALKLQQLGSNIGSNLYSGKCPICGQTIQDTLLPIQNCDHIMSIDENIRHLESQEAMLKYALESHQKEAEDIETSLNYISGQIFQLRRLAKTIRNDLFSVDDDFSETIVAEKIKIENKIIALRQLQNNIDYICFELKKLSELWREYLDEKKKLPKSHFSSKDLRKISLLEKYFKQYLEKFDYQSVKNYDGIQISVENYLPTSDGFDMKFDSSASDNIRAIWAYTIALLKTSLETQGNHPAIIIFDEPAQHSIDADDIISLFDVIDELPLNTQVIFGITLNDTAVKKAALQRADADKLTIIDVGTHSFKEINK